MLCDRDSITYYPVSVKYLCQVFWNELAGQGGGSLLINCVGLLKSCGNFGFQPVDNLWKTCGKKSKDFRDRQIYIRLHLSTATI